MNRLDTMQEKWAEFWSGHPWPPELELHLKGVFFSGVHAIVSGISAIDDAVKDDQISPEDGAVLMKSHVRSCGEECDVVHSEIVRNGVERN